MSKAQPTGEIVREIWIDAAPATVFALLTDAKRMTSWLAETVLAEPVAGGVFRIVEPGGEVIEGSYLEVVADRKVVFTWGGTDGLKPGESTVEITLEPSGSGTHLRLRHHGIPNAAIESHDAGWSRYGLPKLQAAATCS